MDHTFCNILCFTVPPKEIIEFEAEIIPRSDFRSAQDPNLALSEKAFDTPQTSGQGLTGPIDCGANKIQAKKPFGGVVGTNKCPSVGPLCQVDEDVDELLA
ncbi:hypothetical protein Tco_0731719 [Tanacetum coccineum]